MVVDLSDHGCRIEYHGKEFDRRLKIVMSLLLHLLEVEIGTHKISKLCFRLL